jgi:hypothetical protein
MFTLGIIGTGACSADDVGYNSSGGASGQGGTTASGHGGTTASGGATTESGGVSATGGAAGAAEPGGAGGAGGAAEELGLEEVRQGYKSFTQRTDEPEPISSEIFGLCRAPSAAEQQFAESVHGKELYLLDWLNEEAQAGYAEKGNAAFPVGAAIVKEKLVRSGTSYEVAALGIMIKRAAGFDSAHGDWEFGYWEPAAGLVAGASEATYCGACHASSSTDFVFLDDSWRAP